MTFSKVLQSSGARDALDSRLMTDGIQVLEFSCLASLAWKSHVLSILWRL
jgi:hypothetical protein